MRARLFQPAPKVKADAPLSTCTDVVLLDSAVCPTCGRAVSVHDWTQPALFYFGGYGAATQRRQRRCLCGWALPVDELSRNPRGI